MNLLNMIRNGSKVSDFVIKIIAIVCMTIDHIGYFIAFFVPELSGAYYTLYMVFRAIGRIALPLFCFLIVEGTLHTHSVGKYIMRLAIVGAVVLIFQIVTEYALKDFAALENMGNIFIDLILGVLFVWSLEQKRNPSLRLLALIPVAIGILSYVCFAIEEGNNSITSINWYPYYLRCQYGWYSIACVGCFYAGYKVTQVYYKNNPIVNITYDEEGNEVPVVDEHPESYPNYRALINIYGCVFFVIVRLLLWVLAMIAPGYDWLDGAYETYAIIAIVLLLFASGERGYNAKWFNISSYAYYPVHLVILYIIFWLVI